MENPIKTRSTERWYESQLRKVARHVSDIIGGFPPGDPASLNPIDKAMTAYADLLDGWARATGAQMIARVNKNDETAWVARAREMASWLKRELRTTATGPIMQSLLDEQVGLIKSIPLEAAQRVHRLTQEAQLTSARASSVAAEILRTNEVTESRAKLIARTEVARTAASLTEARARRIGSVGYIWRTSKDGAVRESHKEMEGVYVPWDTPPTLSDGTVTHAGCIYNCRCFSEPVIPDF